MEGGGLGGIKKPEVEKLVTKALYFEMIFRFLPPSEFIYYSIWHFCIMKKVERSFVFKHLINQQCRHPQRVTTMDRQKAAHADESAVQRASNFKATAKEPV
jgi:hypothetical protein